VDFFPVIHMTVLPSCYDNSVASMGSVTLFTWSLESILHASRIKLIRSVLV